MYKGQIICIIIISLIGAFYVTSKRKKTVSSQWFSAYVIIALVQIFFDMCSCYTVNHLETVSPIWNRVVHCLYIVCTWDLCCCCFIWPINIWKH